MQAYLRENYCRVDVGVSWHLESSELAFRGLHGEAKHGRKAADSWFGS